MRIFNVCLAILVFAGCATGGKFGGSSGDKPLWMEDKNKAYPQAEYLSALGSGDTYEDAKRVAKGNISQIFRSDISAVSSTVQKYSEILDSKGLSQSESTQQNKSVEVSSNQSLVNIKFAGKYVDGDGKVYTLAFIDRDETGKIYEQRISDNEDNLTSFVDEAKKSKDIITQYSCYRAALAYAKLNRDLLDQLQVISPKDAQMSLITYSYSKLSSQVRKLGKKITYAVQITDDKQDEVKNIIERIMSNLDFTGTKKPLLQVKGKIVFEEEDLSKSVKFYRWNLSVKIVRTDENKVIFSIDKVGRDGGLSAQRAKQVSYYQMRKFLGKSIKKELDAYFDSRL